MVYVHLPDLNSLKWFADEDSFDGAIERIERARAKLVAIDKILYEQKRKLEKIRDGPRW